MLYCVIPVTDQLKNTFTFETCILMVGLLHLSTDSVCCWKYVDVIHLVCIVVSCLVCIVVVVLCVLLLVVLCVLLLFVLCVLLLVVLCVLLLVVLCVLL